MLLADLLMNMFQSDFARKDVTKLAKASRKRQWLFFFKCGHTPQIIFTPG